MMKMMLSLFMIIITTMMLFIYHPLSMVISILIQTLILCLLTGMLMNSYWFSYILFLTFLGGLLILFIYVSSIASNEIFKMNFNYKLYFFILILSTLFVLFLQNNLYWLNVNFNQEMYMNFNNFTLFFNNENLFNLTKLYNNQNYFLMMMMIIYLFFTLIVIVKITNIFFGPLRSFN